MGAIRIRLPVRVLPLALLSFLAACRSSCNEQRDQAAHKTPDARAPDAHVIAMPKSIRAIPGLHLPNLPDAGALPPE